MDLLTRTDHLKKKKKKTFCFGGQPCQSRSWAPLSNQSYRVLMHQTWTHLTRLFANIVQSFHQWTSFFLFERKVAALPFTLCHSLGLHRCQTILSIPVLALLSTKSKCISADQNCSEASPPPCVNVLNVAVRTLLPVACLMLATRGSENLQFLCL